jgi:hypothetical protein
MPNLRGSAGAVQMEVVPTARSAYSPPLQTIRKYRSAARRLRRRAEGIPRVAAWAAFAAGPLLPWEGAPPSRILSLRTSNQPRSSAVPGRCRDASSKRTSPTSTMNNVTCSPAKLLRSPLRTTATRTSRPTRDADSASSSMTNPTRARPSTVIEHTWISTGTQACSSPPFSSKRRSWRNFVVGSMHLNAKRALPRLRRACCLDPWWLPTRTV